MMKRKMLGVAIGVLAASVFVGGAIQVQAAASNVKVSRFWHNHQPIYWPEWNASPQNERVQFAEDSIDLKGSQGYDSSSLHPENDLSAIFSVNDRIVSYQHGPRNSLASVNTDGGYAMSVSGSLIDNVNSLGEVYENGYSPDWWNGNREASSWTTTAGGAPRLDLVGFTYHHSLGSVLPKEVFRKEIQVFKQAWWKAWNKNSDLSDHSKGFFPTEMGFSRHMTDVLVDEGYEWVIVASHHLSRTSPNYNDNANPEGSYNIFSSPPNKADQLGPNEASGWWFGVGNVGETAWNLAPFAYQLHKSQYINPETGAEKNMIMVPSDDIQSYRAGYSGWQKGMVDANVEPYCNDGARPCIVMPSTDGDNAWGGGSSSWDGDAPGLMNNGTYAPVAPQDFVDSYGAAAGVVHIEDGAWIFPESDYGSPQFLKWVEPPVSAPGLANAVHNTQVDIETPGFATKFYSWAPVMAGANWCITAEQMWEDANGAGTVRPWVIQDPYDNLASDTYLSPNIVERAWHIYLAGLDSGFNYYGGLGNDDEIKSSLATRRAVEILQSYMDANKATSDNTAPTVFKPQRFPYNPGWYTFGWFNSIPGGNSSALKKMHSEFYVWTHAYDVSGITSIVVKVRKDNDGVNSMATKHNELYAGGSDVGSWTTIDMMANKRVLPNTAATLTAAADNGQIEYFGQGITPEVADYYFAEIDESSLPGFRNNLLDYYIEAYDGRGNRHRSEIQHVWVEDDGLGGPPPSDADFSSNPSDCTPLTVTYTANMGPLSNSIPVKMWISFDEGVFFSQYLMTNNGGGVSEYTLDTIPDNAPSAKVYFQNQSETILDNRNGQDWITTIIDCDAPVGPSTVAFTNAPACDPVTIDYRPNGHALQTATQVFAHIGFDNYAIVWPSQPMTKITNNLWRIILTPTTGVTQIDAVFNNGGGTWDNNAGNDWAFAINECDEPDPITGFYITNPSNDITVGNASANFIMNGVGESVVGLIVWTNELTGGSGSVFAGPTWQINSIPLGVGSNTITVVGTNELFGEVTTAEDDSSNYIQETWTNGVDEGTGFGSWALNGSADSGWFIGLDGFGLWSHETNFVSEAIRSLDTPLASGETFRVRIKNGWIWENFSNPAAAGVIGLALRDGSGTTQWEVTFTGGDSNYQSTDGDTGVGWTDSGVEIAFTLTDSTNYSVVLSPLGGSQQQFTGSIPGSIAQFRVWSDGNGTSDGQNHNRDLYFDDIAVTMPGGGSVVTTSDTVVIVREGADDSNGDGIPDSWYNKYGMNPATIGLATNNSDGDILLNWEEYIYDTDPTNSASYHEKRIEYAYGNGSMDVRVEGPTSTGRWYDIFWATSLINSTWNPMDLNVPGDAGNGPVMLKVTNTVPVRYYRTGPKLPTP